MNTNKSMLRVAHLISTSGLYGAERWVLGLLRHLHQVETVLICPSTSNLVLLEEAQKLDIASVALPVKGNFAFTDFVSRLSHLLVQEKIDILHTHGYKSDILGLFAARKSGIKILSTPHGWSAGESLKLAFYEHLNRFVFRFFDRVVPLSTDLEKTLRHVSPEKVKMIKNFVDLDSLPPIQSGDLRLITYIGQLIERKRIQDLITALTHIPDKDVRLQIIGDGPIVTQLTDLSAMLGLTERVTFCGFRPDRLELLNRSGIMVLPSVLEGIPRALMEAMALQKVVIGTDIPGTRDLIQDQETGILVPVKAPERIAAAIRSVLASDVFAHKLAQNAKASIHRDFSAQSAAQEYEVLYKQLQSQ